MAKTIHFMLALAVLWVAAAGRAWTAPQQERPAAAGRPSADAAAVDRGRDAFRANCGFCHGIDARGAQGPDLARSLAVLNDDQGKDLGNFLKAAKVVWLQTGNRCFCAGQGKDEGKSKASKTLIFFKCRVMTLMTPRSYLTSANR